jgi:hypothetical protein
MKNWLAAGFTAFGLATNGVDGQWAAARFGTNWPAAVNLPERSTGANAERAKWQLSHRLQGGWEYDNNIYELGLRRTASGSARFLLNTRGDRRSNRWQVYYNYSTALQTYPRHGDENKLSHDLHGQAGVRLKSWLHVSAQANATLKLYLENAVDYGTTSGNLTASLSLPHQLVAGLSGETGQLDYAVTDSFDFTFTGVELALRRPLSASGALEALLNWRALRYQRHAFEYNLAQGLFPRPWAQRDALTTLRLALTYGRKVVMRIALEAQLNRSNSFGYDFNRFRVSGLLGFRPASRWMLRAAGLVQNKNYCDDLSRLNLRDLDTEREQSNFLVVDLSRDLATEISLVTRAAFYDNESIVPGKFYRKTLYFAGVEIRL